MSQVDSVASTTVASPHIASSLPSRAASRTLKDVADFAQSNGLREIELTKIADPDADFMDTPEMQNLCSRLRDTKRLDFFVWSVWARFYAAWKYGLQSQPVPPFSVALATAIDCLEPLSVKAAQRGGLWSNHRGYRVFFRGLEWVLPFSWNWDVQPRGVAANV